MLLLMNILNREYLNIYGYVKKGDFFRNSNNSRGIMEHPGNAYNEGR